jgi:hypothetical protein
MCLASLVYKQCKPPIVCCGCRPAKRRRVQSLALLRHSIIICSAGLTAIAVSRGLLYWSSALLPFKSTEGSKVLFSFPLDLGLERPAPTLVLLRCRGKRFWIEASAACCWVRALPGQSCSTRSLRPLTLSVLPSHGYRIIVIIVIIVVIVITVTVVILRIF